MTDNLFLPPDNPAIGALCNKGSNQLRWVDDFNPMDITPGLDFVGTFRECWEQLQSMYNLPPGISCVLQNPGTCESFVIHTNCSEYQVQHWRDLCAADQAALADVICSVNYPIALVELTVPGEGQRRIQYGYYVTHPDIIRSGTFSWYADSQEAVQPFIDNIQIPKTLWKKVFESLPPGQDWRKRLTSSGWVWHQPELCRYVEERTQKNEQRHATRRQKEKKKSETLITINNDINIWTTDMARIFNCVRHGYALPSPAGYTDTALENWTMHLGDFQLVSKPGAYRHLRSFQNILRKLKQSPKQPTLERERYKRLWEWLKSHPIPRKFREVPTRELIDWKRLEKLWPGCSIRYQDEAKTVPYNMNFDGYPDPVR